MNKQACFTNNSDEWRTPRDLFDRLNSIYHFKLDACASHENALVKDYFTKEDNSLTKDWKSVTWCNPPYSMCKEFVKKAYEERLKNNLSVMLIPSRTDTKYFHDYLYNKPGIRLDFIKGRLKFSESKNSAPFPSLLVYMV